MNIQQAFINVTKRLPANDPAISKRIERAYDICISHGYMLQQHADKSWSVYRASTSLLEDSSAQYLVDKSGCTCPDAMTVRAGLCKHRIACMIKEEMAKYTEEELCNMPLTTFSMLCRDYEVQWLNKPRGVVVKALQEAIAKAESKKE